MNRKLEYKFVKKFVEDQGYELLSREYTGNKIKLKMRCPEGHEIMMSWSKFYCRSQRCSVCSKTRKKTIGEVREYIESQGQELLSKEYVNAKIKLKIKCSEGHTYYITWNSFYSNNSRCSYCYGNTKHTYKFVKEYIKRQNCELLSKEYVNQTTKLKIQCSEGHIYNMRYVDFYHNHQRCIVCYRKSIKGTRNSKCKNYTEVEIKSFKKYRRIVTTLTKRSYNKFKEIVNPKKLPRGNYMFHLDHIYPICLGFKNHVPPEVISNPLNLQMLWWRYNIKKRDKTEVSESDLYISYKIFDSYIRSEN